MGIGAHRLANESMSILYMYVYVGVRLTKIFNAKKCPMIFQKFTQRFKKIKKTMEKSLRLFFILLCIMNSLIKPWSPLSLPLLFREMGIS